ncbi:hypothetical protein EFP84_18900 [Leptospira kmetyi]|uniref:Uncharacterized protein n=1 Tax=Leptospira kmetyi TaxID=408139 RepID=A0AAD0UTI3_9LEPT|nr:hypothetical protein [Leptospira kmetyi]AYV57709.1 hypothetical protein EFP84_18900 [Leptospira kmetyi]
MIMQVLGYFGLVVCLIVIDISFYHFFLCSLLSICGKDGVPLLVSLIATTTIIPTYLFTRIKEFKDKKLDIEKTKSIKKYDMKFDQFRLLIPYLYLKNSPANLIAYSKLHSEALSYINERSGNKDFKITSLIDYETKYDHIKNNPRANVFDFAQASISQIAWSGSLLFSQKTMGLLKEYNSVDFDQESSVKHIQDHTGKLLKLINSMREELDAENLSKIEV